MDTSYFVDYRYAKKLAEPLSINLFKINQGISEISFYLVYQKKKISTYFTHCPRPNFLVPR